MTSLMTNLDSILKSRDIALPTKICLVKAMVFPVGMYECESWTIKKAECRRIDAFELWCWRRLLRVPCTAGRSNQSILKEINPEYSLKDWCWRSSNTLATWCEEPTHWKRPWCSEKLKVGEGDYRGWDAWIASPTMDMRLNKLHEIVKDREAWCAAVCWFTKSRTWLSDWTELNPTSKSLITNHQNKYSNHRKLWNAGRITKIWHRHKVRKCYS